MAQQDKTTFENTFNDSSTGLFKDNTSKDIGANDSRTLVTNIKDSFLNLVDGGTVIGFVQLGNTGTVPIVAVNLVSKNQTNSSSGAKLNGIFYIDQTAATTGSAQGVEGYVKTSNATGTVVMGIGAVGNIEHSGAGTLSYARPVQAGGIVSGSGTVTEWAAFYAQPLAITGSGTVTNVFGIYLDTASAGSGTITNRYGVYQVDTNAVNLFNGKIVGANIIRTSNIDYITFQSTGSNDSQDYIVDWVTSSVVNGGTLSQSVNIFLSTSFVELEDKSALVEYNVLLTKSDGSDNQIKRILVGYRKDGAADPVQTGSASEIFSVGNVTPTVTFSIAGGNPQITINDNTSGGWKVKVWAKVSISN